MFDGKVTVQDLAITPKTKTEEGIVVRSTSTARKETAAAIISFQKNTNTVALGTEIKGFYFVARPLR